MGASTDYVLIKAGPTEKAKVQKEWNERVEDDLWQNGREYSGSIGMLQGKIQFRGQVKTIAQAINTMETRHRKWEPPIGVFIQDEDEWLVGGWCSS